MHPEPDFESSATRRAYRALLGDNYDETLFAHVELSSAAKAFARDLETAVEWNRGGIDEWLNVWPPPGPYQPTLGADRGGDRSEGRRLINDPRARAKGSTRRFASTCASRATSAERSAQSPSRDQRPPGSKRFRRSVRSIRCARRYAF